MGDAQFVFPYALPDADSPESFARWLSSFNDLFNAKKEKDQFRLCYSVTVLIKAELYNKKIPLADLPQKYIAKVLIPVTTTIIECLEKYRGTDPSVIATLRYFREAEIQFNVAMNLFTKKDEPEAAKRVEGRTRALSQARDALSKIMKQWYYFDEELEHS